MSSSLVNSLLLGGFVVASFLLTVRFTAILCARASDWLPDALGRSTTMRAVIALLPVALGAGVALSVVPVTALFGACHCVSHPHHLHLCFDHAGFAWSLVVVCVAGLLALAATLRELGSFAADLVRTHRWSRNLIGRTIQREGGSVEIASDVGARAITLGVFTPRVIVGERLWLRLREDERSAVVAHERAHARRRDPLTLVALRAAACLMPRAAGARLVADWRRAAEITCDAHAAEALRDPYLLAETLVTCGRLQLADGASPEPCVALGAADPRDLSLRVNCLLDQSVKSTPTKRGDLVGAGLWLLLVVLVIAGFGGSSAHHALETALGWTV